MLEITVPETTLFDEVKEEFIPVPETHLLLEHSLLSIKAWEEKWHKPFLKQDEEKTTEEIADYIRCMTISPKKVDQNVYRYMPIDVLQKIMDYIHDPMTATTITERQGGKKGRGRIITAELIYCWMVTLNIPVEFQKWHINQLLTLIKVCDIENSPKEKMSKKDAASRRAALNKARRAKHHTKG